MLEFTKFSAEYSFLLISDFPAEIAFLYILVAVCKVSHHFINISKIYNLFSMGVNPEVSFLQLLQKESKIFFLSTLLEDQHFLSHLAR